MAATEIRNDDGQPTDVDERALIISSDGHVSAQMEEYRPYLPASWHDEFDAFCKEFREKGTRTFERQAMDTRVDREVAEQWEANVLETGRIEGAWDPERRFVELAREGVAAEVLFPDFGIPFEMYPPFLAAALGFTRTQAQIDVADRAYNRWLADFCKSAPERFAGMATVSFADVDDTMEEIRWAKEAALKGIVLPFFDEDVPIFSAQFDPIWSLLEELEMPVNSHTGITAITKRQPVTAAFVPHPALVLPIYTPQAFFYVHQILTHLIWGGVLERHPNLQVVLTEQGSGWVVGALQQMDYTYEGSYLRRDAREVVRHKPSDYFQRQVHMGSSLLSLGETQARHRIGVEKMAIGVDYPHQEGTWGQGPSTLDYLQATLGAAGVPADEARLMLGENAARVWGFDLAPLRRLANETGPKLKDVLTPPTKDLFPRGDVHKPAASGTMF